MIQVIELRVRLRSFRPQRRGSHHLATFLATLAADPTATDLPEYVIEEFYASLQGRVLAHGFVRLGCDTRPQRMLLAA